MLNTLNLSCNYINIFLTWTDWWWSLENLFSSLNNFEICKIEVLADISVSLINFANMCRDHWHLVAWLWRVVTRQQATYFLSDLRMQTRPKVSSALQYIVVSVVIVISNYFSRWRKRPLTFVEYWIIPNSYVSLAFAYLRNT